MSRPAADAGRRKGHAERRESVFTAPIVVWAILLVLLFSSVGAAFAPLGSFKTSTSLAIAGIKVVLIGLVFMRLNRSSNLVRLAAGAGVVWASFLFLMAGCDYISRGGG